MNKLVVRVPGWCVAVVAAASLGVSAVACASDSVESGKDGAETVAKASRTKAGEASAPSETASPKVLVVEKIAAEGSPEAKSSNVRCRKVAPIGTRIRRTRCVTVQQAAQQSANDQRRLERIQRMSRPRPGGLADSPVGP